MNHHYSDIRARLGEPQWWDENAVPRYCEFTPRDVADIYARAAVLLLIECQHCGREFKACMSEGSMRVNPWASADGKIVLYPSLAELVESGELHYGDPPNVNCCPAGPTMNSVPQRVLEFWEDDRDGWRRRPELERAIDCEWVR